VPACVLRDVEPLVPRSLFPIAKTSELPLFLLHAALRL
jgi:hypothetical protein